MDRPLTVATRQGTTCFTGPRGDELLGRLTASQTVEAGAWLNKTVYIGCRWGYSSLHWPADSPIFDRIKASGLANVDWQNVYPRQPVGPAVLQ